MRAGDSRGQRPTPLPALLAAIVLMVCVLCCGWFLWSTMGLAHNHTKITPKPTTKTQTIEPTKATGFPTQTTKSEKTTKEEKSIAPKDVGTVRAGSYCSTPGATGRTSAGTLLTCKKASDGKYRWKS